MKGRLRESATASPGLRYPHSPSEVAAALPKRAVHLARRGTWISTSGPAGATLRRTSSLSTLESIESMWT
jgi:hypothetical protein